MIKLLRFVSLLLLLTCNDNYLPKPNAFLSLDYPLTNYNDVKFYPKGVSLQYNSAVSSIESINNSNTLISKRINYKEHNASILIDLHEINNNMDLSRILNELNDFTNIHLKKKNSVINVQEYKNESQRLYASIIKIKGDVTSPYQFYITDSLKNMITASVRYNKSIKYDSVLPSLKYIEKDIYHLIETLTWNSKND
jgi:gliding motility-associated lipoprotein GldD